MEKFNRALWVGLKGEGAPYPDIRSGKNLRANRASLLKAYQAKAAKVCNNL